MKELLILKILYHNGKNFPKNYSKKIKFINKIIIGSKGLGIGY